MKRDKNNVEEILRRSWSSASPDQVEVASRRVLDHLRSNADTEEAAMEDYEKRSAWGFRTLAIGAATLIAGLLLLILTGDLQSWYVLGAVVIIGVSAVWFFRAFHLSRKLRLRRRKAEHERLPESAEVSAAAPEQT